MGFSPSFRYSCLSVEFQSHVGQKTLLQPHAPTIQLEVVKHPLRVDDIRLFVGEAVGILPPPKLASAIAVDDGLVKAYNHLPLAFLHDEDLHGYGMPPAHRLVVLMQPLILCLIVGEKLLVCESFESCHGSCARCLGLAPVASKGSMQRYG